MKLIAQALVKAQRGFSPALKTSTNPHFKSRYADLSACVEAVIDSLNESGIALIQRTHECESGLMVETVFVHESGEIFEAGKLHVPASKNDPQGYGSALTYARRYSLMAACGIAPEDDDGNAASKITPKAKVTPITPTAGALDGFDKDEQEFLHDVAVNITKMFLMNEPIAKIYGELEERHLGNEEKIAIWSLLDSKCRSAIKKHKESLKPSLAEQA